MATKIKKIEYYLPENIVSNEYLEETFKKWKSKKVYKKTGIKKRHVTGENETALDLAEIVGKKILKDFDKSKIDFLILCTQSPEYYLPSGACILQNKLNLRTDIGAFDFNLGCSGYIYGLTLAKSLINGNVAENILLITADTYSKYLNEEDLANRTIFGDAATATIVTKSDEEHIFESSLGTDGSGKENLIVKNGGLKNRFEPDLIAEDDGQGNLRTDNDIYMNGPEIFNFTISHVPVTFSDTLKKNNKQLNDLDFVIFHQANKFILDYLRDLCEIPEDKFYLDLEETGNTVSNTIPIALKKSIDSGVIKKGDKVLLLGFGVGYSWGGITIKI